MRLQWRRFRRKTSGSYEEPANTTASHSPINADELPRSGNFVSRTGLRPASEAQQDLQPSGPGSFPNFRGSGHGPEHKLTNNLGLSVLYQPAAEASLDIIFVHGLGGASHKTWSKLQDPNLFWPERWLPLEPEIGSARILTFGYNADFRHGGPKNISNVTDFAKDLLFAMRFGKDGKIQDLKIGKVPIIFVAHSMGGLVVKKAHLLGQNDENYQDIVKSITAIVFLATPHRGTNLAQLLNRILSVSFQSPKDFIADLNKSSPALEEINEQFRHAAPRLSIFSFYETISTSIGPKRVMVLEKDSSILGYPGEISKPLNADHHDVCKYTGQEDPNYVSVRNALQSLVQSLSSKGTIILNGQVSQDLEDAQRLFGTPLDPEEDLNFFQQRRTEGTCSWILSEPSFRLWQDERLESYITWLTSPPASGKSILSTYIINLIRDLGYDCQYFFFRFGDQTKRSISSLLRSLGSQLARSIPHFRRIVARFSRENIRLEKTDVRVIWQKIFVSAMSQISFSNPIYWVIDGVDESDSPRQLLDLFQSLSTSFAPLRILLISRKTEHLSLAFERLSNFVRVGIIDNYDKDHNASDIQFYVEQEVNYVRGTEKLKRIIINNILRRANGNFLWVHLVMEEIARCYTQEAIEQTLEEALPGMEALYRRMDLAIANNPRQIDRDLAKRMLAWTICAHRSLTLRELSRALLPAFPAFLDLRRSIQDVCGHFLVVDQTSHIVMVHQSARDYLTKTPNLSFSIDLGAAHEEISISVLSCLLDPRLRSKVEQEQHGIQDAEPFLLYAATSWPYHIHHMATSSDNTFAMLLRFFGGQSVLTWIHVLAFLGHLDVLVEAARCITTFVKLNRKLNVGRDPLFHRLEELELLDLWAIDLMKIVGKFGRHLKDDPMVIYHLIPPFCPRNSAIAQKFGGNSSFEVAVSHITNSSWSDCLARISLHGGAKALKIVCAGRYFAVLSSAGAVFLGDSVNFEEINTLYHGEYISNICLNTRCDRLVSYGLKMTKIWSVPLGQIIASVPSVPDTKALAITFTIKDERMLAAFEDRLVRYLDAENMEAGWHVLDPTLLRETSEIKGGFINTPSCMVFNSDATQLAVAYRGFPLSVWSMSRPRLMGRCKRRIGNPSEHNRPRDSSTSWMAAKRIVWHPFLGHLLGLYKDGTIFKWNPSGNDYHEVCITADEIEISSDGSLFVTSDSRGTVKLWNFDYFNVIYQLSSESLVAGLTFSPDCKRFYDLRGSSINVWEPTSLLRFSRLSDPEDTLSKIASQAPSEDQIFASASQASEAWVESAEPICALAAAQHTTLYCAATERGEVELFDTSKGKLLEIFKFLNSLTVSHLAWSDDGSHIAAADIGGNVRVKSINIATSDTAEFEPRTIFEAKLKVDTDAIQQILLNQGSTRLFIAGQGSAQSWVIEQGSLEAWTTFGKGESRKWINHPRRKDILIGFGAHDLKTIRWSDLSEVPCLKLRGDWPRLQSRTSFDAKETQDVSSAHLSLKQGARSAIERSVSKAAITQDRLHVLAQISEGSSQGRKKKGILILPIASLEVEDSSTTLGSLYVAGNIQSKIEVPLGILPGGRFIFLDKDLWMCTFELGSLDAATGLKRHYFIPRDWVSTEALEQCCVLENGTLLLPKDDEVAVIKSSLEADGWR